MDEEHDVKESDGKYSCEVCEDEGCADCEYIYKNAYCRN